MQKGRREIIGTLREVCGNYVRIVERVNYEKDGGRVDVQVWLSKVVGAALEDPTVVGAVGLRKSSN